jgi:choline monooxygenase
MVREFAMERDEIRAYLKRRFGHNSCLPTTGDSANRRQAMKSHFGTFDPDLPLESARTIPAFWYRDADVYEAERRAVFGNAWLVAGRREPVNEAGSYLTTEIAGEPILVLRDQDAVLRAFVNVCRHRAAPVMTEPCGQATKLRCRYHGWTYDLAGRLRGVPEFDGVGDFRREEQGLPPLAVAEWGPYVWIHGGTDPPPLTGFLAPLPERASGRVERMQFAKRMEYDLACNWKVFVDNYLDGGYHVNTVHPGLAGIVDYGRYHTEVFDYNSVQVSPLKAPAAGSVDVAGVRGGSEAQYWWVFPNFMLNLYEGVMDTNLVLPLGSERCRVVFDFYFAPGTPETFIRDSIAVADRIQQEDAGICEEVQRGLGSRSYDTGRFSVRREAAGYHFHQLLGRRLRSPSGRG